MKNKKRWIAAISLLALLASFLLPTYCFAMVGFTSIDVNANNHPFAALESAFVQQTNDGTAYTLRDTAESFLFSPPNGRIKKVNPSYHFSGGGLIGYLIKNTADLRFSFFIHDSSESSSTGIGDDITHLDTILLPPEWARGGCESASSRYHYKTNNFNLTMGHWVRPAHQLYFRPYMGIGLANIEMRQVSDYFNVASTEDEAFSEYNARVKEQSSVTAVGPLIGTNISWNLFRPFSIEADASFGLLGGRIHSSYTATNNFENPTQNPVSITSLTNRILLKSITVKLGLGVYTHISRHATAQIIAGYKFSEYLHAIATHTLPSKIGQGISQHLFEDSGFSGAFLSMAFRLV